MNAFMAFYNMNFNPFDKDIDVKHGFKSKDFNQVMDRLNYLKQIRGMGLVTGEPGSGKTFILRSFVETLNPSLFKAVYIPIATLTVMDFYRALCHGLGIIPPFRKVDMFREIQQSIYGYFVNKGITPVIIIDEAQFISNAILDDLRLILNFDMDSKNYAMLILSGQTPLIYQLNRQTHEVLRQRILLNYTVRGLSKDETKAYIEYMLKTAGVTTPIFDDSAIELLFTTTNGYIRKINNLVTMSLIAGSQAQCRTIDGELVYKAQNELSIKS